jgi:hypothetical protein
MGQLKQFILVLISFSVLSCGNTKHVTAERDLRIDFYTYGGFVGDAAGVTVTGDGWAKTWNGRTATLRHVRDSVRVDQQNLARIDSLAASEEFSALHTGQTGNLTTVLTVQRGAMFHQISFSGEQVPGQFPQSAKDLISALKSLQAK